MADQQVQLLDLRGRTAEGFNLGESVSRSLRDGLPRKLPGEHPSDAEYAYTRSISTIALYSDEGLSIYEKITGLEEYYPFKAELDILERYGDEIACRMFGLPTSYLQPASKKEEREQGHRLEHERDESHLATPKKEKWGDEAVGINNYGVNGGLNKNKPLITGLAVELGSGSLDKTRHLLRSLSKLLQQQGDQQAALAHIDYKALDLEKQSLLTTLSSLAESEADSVTTSRKSRRVSISGIVATYDEGLEALRSQSKARSKSTVSETSSSTAVSEGDIFSSASSHSSETSATSESDEDSKEPIKSLLWLGSSIGNMKRTEAAAFLRSLGADNLGQNDTLVIGIDNCNDGPRIEKAYDDSLGVTRSFILQGVDQAGEAINEPNLTQKNFDYVSRWNAHEGRHEAFIRCKVDNLAIRLPAVGEELGETTVHLKKDELVHVEESHKYTFDEALTLFNAAGLRLVQHWQDSRKLHTVYLLEKPAFSFKSNHPDVRALCADAQSNTCGLPSLGDWQEMWKCWDMLTREVIPRSLLLTKPIPLRHVILFYLGHIPGFADIHLSRVLGRPLTEPKHFADIFERGIDPDVADPSKINHSHSAVPDREEDWPKVEEIDEYQSLVRQRIASVYDKDVKMTRALSRVMAMIFEHEAMHMETLVYIAVQAASQLQPPSGLAIPDFASLARGWQETVESDKQDRYGVLSIGATEVDVGHDDSDRVDEGSLYDPEHRLGWDCENPKRRVKVDAFKLSKVPVENWQYLEWLVSSDARQEMTPASWHVDGDLANVSVKTLAGLVPFEQARYWPVAASAKQLEAYAKSIGGRLPTAAELAAFQQGANSPVDTAVNNIGLVNLHPVPALTPHELRNGTTGNATDGGVWLWTSDVLAPWDGYEASRLYPGYSSDFFDGQHLVIKGASYATIPRLARPSFCNWYQAAYPYVLAGARIAFD